MDYQPKLLKYGFGTLLGSLLVVALLVLPGRAGAADSSLTFNYGAQPVPTTLFWGPGPGALLHGPSDTFTDHILFSTSTPFFASLFDNFTNFANFASLSVALRTDDVAHTVVYAATPNTPAFPFAWTNSTPSSAIAAGNYQLHISGVMAASITPNPTGESGGIILAAIPEPETYAMMLAGLGLIGFVARRRRQKEAA